MIILLPKREDFINRIQNVINLYVAYCPSVALQEIVKVEIYNIGKENGYVPIPELIVKGTQNKTAYKRIDMMWYPTSISEKICNGFSNCMFEIDWGINYNSIEKLLYFIGNKVFVYLTYKKNTPEFNAVETQWMEHCIEFLKFVVPKRNKLNLHRPCDAVHNKNWRNENWKNFNYMKGNW